MALSPTQRGMGFMLISTLAFVVMNTMIRDMSSDLHPFEIGFFRCLFGVLCFAPLFVRQGWAPLKTEKLKAHLWRGAVNGVSMLFFNLALKYTPLAKLTALFFTQPLFGSILALVVLHEVIRARRIAALAVGFCGMLIIAQPGTDAFDIGSGFVLCAAVLSGYAVVLIKQLAKTESSVSITVFTGLVTTPIALVMAIPVWIAPSLEQLALLVVIGILGSIGQLSMVRAFSLADATAVLPLDFFKLIWSAILGWLFLGEIVEPTTWIGGAVIFAASVYVAHRERKAGR